MCRVVGIILRGICLMRKQEMDWFFGGCRALVPQAWDNFMNGLHPSERDDPCKSYFARLTHSEKDVQMAAAKHWGAFEQSLALGRSDKLQVCTLIHSTHAAPVHLRLCCHGTGSC